MDADVVIIGGGLAGLACAVELIGSGLRVTLIEQDSILGGRARSWLDPHTNDVVDIGPHILTTEHRNMLALLKRFGTDTEILWQTDKLITLLENRRRIVMRSARLPPPAHLVPSLLAVPTISTRDALSNAKVVWLAMRFKEADVARFDAQDAITVLTELGVSKRFIEWFWASACLALLNVPLERCSAGALLRFYKHLIGHNDLHIGFPRCALGDLFAPQATQELTDAGAQLLLNTRVRQLITEQSAVTGVLLQDGTRIRARYCVAALPPQDLLPLLPAAWIKENTACANFKAFLPSPYISGYLWFDRKLTQQAFWARVWSPSDLNTDFYDLSNIRSGWQDRPSLIASNVIYSHQGSALSDEEILGITLREIADFAPKASRARLVHHRIHRTPMAIPCPYPGTEQRRPATDCGIPGLYLAGDWTRTALPASMESAVCSGRLAAEALFMQLGQPRRLALPPRETAGIVRLIQGLCSRQPMLRPGGARRDPAGTAARSREPAPPAH